MNTLPLLIVAGVQPSIARQWAPMFDQHMPAFSIDTPPRIAGFLGQIMVESVSLTAVEENLFYTTAARLMAVWPSRFKTAAQCAPYLRNPKALANFVYANRNGNGDEASGDGWRFRGRGPKQLTWRVNYEAAARDLGRPYVAQPELVALPMDGTLTACSYWLNAGCNRFADAQNWDGVTRAVNGRAMLQARERAAISRRVLKAMA